jgi:hypothetical protein
MPARVVRIELDGACSRLQCLIVPAHPQERPRDVRPVSQRVQLLGPLLHHKGFVIPLQRQTHAPVQVVRIGAVGSQMLDVVREVHGRHAAPPQLALDGIAAGEGGVEAGALIGRHGWVRR